MFSLGKKMASYIKLGFLSELTKLELYNSKIYLSAKIACTGEAEFCNLNKIYDQKGD
jgi:hypothetical protein